MGTSDRGQVVVRCNTCGERSTVPLEPEHGALEPTPADAVGIELDAMRTIAGALAALDDPDARCRVLHWAAERFGEPSRWQDPPSASVEPPLPPSGPPSGGSPGARDLSLSVDGLELMFENAPDPAADAPGGHTSVSSMLRGFVTEFQRLAFEWQET